MSEPFEDRYRTLRVKLPIQSPLVVSEHRRLPWGGVGYGSALAPEVRAWCETRGIPLPKIGTEPDNPGAFYVFFENEDHAFEFKMRWYEADGR